MYHLRELCSQADACLYKVACLSGNVATGAILMLPMEAGLAYSGWTLLLTRRRYALRHPIHAWRTAFTRFRAREGERRIEKSY